MTEKDAEVYFLIYHMIESSNIGTSKFKKNKNSYLLDALDVATTALKEIQQYREIGTVEEFKKALKEEDVLKFYYCESEDDYYIGKRVQNFYYARYGETGFEWFMSRYLPWGEHVFAPHTLWKNHTYPSEPKEISFFDWLQGFLKKYCGGTVEKCREAVEKQIEHVPYYQGDGYDGDGNIIYDTWICPNCGKKYEVEYHFYKYCLECGQAIQMTDKRR